jgi:PAS domain S-box-containing protein
MRSNNNGSDQAHLPTTVSAQQGVDATSRAEAVERERAGDLLRKSEAALTQTRRLVRIGSWHWEVNPDITSWSEELYRIFGRDPTRPAPSYAEHAQLYTPQSWLALQAAVARTLSVGEPCVLELEYVRADGATGWVEARGEAERDDQGTIIGLHGTAQEITARRDARQRQRQHPTSEHFRQRLEALTPGVVHIFDLEKQRNVYISRSVASLLGYSPAEVEAMGADVLAALMHPEDRLRFPEHLEHIRLARDDETADFEYRMRHRAGVWRWFQSRDTVFSRDDRGAVRELIGTAIDIDSRKQNELALRHEIAERQAAQVRLRSSEERYRRMLDTAHEGIWTIDAEGRTTYVNQHMARLLGYAPAELMGRAHTDFMWEEDRPEGDAALELRRSNIPRVWDQRYRRKNGSVLWTMASCSSIFDDDGHFAGALGMFTDITERKQTEEALRQSTAMLRAIGDTTGDVIFAKDIDGRLTYANPATLALIGKSADEVLGRTDADFLSDKPAARQVMANDQRIMASGVAEDVEEVVPSPDGTPRTWLSRKMPYRDATGKVAGLTGVSRDITSRKQAEEALRESEQRFRMMADGLPLLVWVHDAPGDLQFINQTYCDFFGVTVQQIAGQNWRPLVHADDVAGYAAEFLACVEARRPFQAEVRVRRVDGQWRWMESRARPRLASSGEFLGMVGCSVDITERKRSEAALRASEAFSRLVLESSPDCVQILDADGCLAFMNRNGQRLMEFDDFGVLKGRPWEQIWPDAERARVREAVANGLRGEVSRFKASAATATGQTRWWDVIVAPVSTAVDGMAPMSLICVARDITAQTEAEQQLYLRDRAIAAADAGVFIVDPHAQGFPIVFASEGFERMTGYAASDVLGLNGRFLQGRDTDPGAVARLSEAVHAHRPVREALVNYRKDGTPFWNDVAISPVTDAQGRVTHLVGIQNDVSALFALQAALQASNDRLALGVDIANLALAEIDYDSDCNHLTPEAAMAFGLGQVAMVVPREQVHATFHPDDREELARRITECLDPAGSGRFAMDHRIVWPDGTVHWLTVRKRVFFSGKGQARRPQRAVLAVRDVTEQKGVEARLVDSLNRVQLATEATAVGIWEWNVLNNTVRWDVQMFRLYGMPPTPDGHVRYEDWTSAVLPDDLVDQERILQDTAQRGGRSRREFRIRRHLDGQQRDIEAVEVGLRNAAGNIEWVLGTNLDITERKEVERQLQRAAAALTDADRRKDEFLATLSHELRNPLAPVSNSLALLKRVPGNIAVIERARATMERQLAQLVRLIDDLLDVSRITRDKLTLKREPALLADIVHDAVELCQPHFDRAHQSLSVTLPSSPVPMHADAARLVQVLGNLLNNASKYTPAGGHVELRAEFQLTHVVVTVRDNGIGIPADMQARVFDLFAQVDSSRELSKGGLGIGLALAKRLAEMHGGTITVSSEGSGRGSEFVVRLPVMRADPEAIAAADGSGATARKAGRRVLVVDDNQDSAESIALLLQFDGHQTRTAHDGPQALDMASSFRPDVILLDIGLPNLGGYEVCRRLRQQPWTSNALIIAMTGWGQADDLRKSAHAGFDKHCVKPVDHDALTALILQDRPVQDQSDAPPFHGA